MMEKIKKDDSNFSKSRFRLKPVLMLTLGLIPALLLPPGQAAYAGQQAALSRVLALQQALLKGRILDQTKQVGNCWCDNQDCREIFQQYLRC